MYKRATVLILAVVGFALPRIKEPFSNLLFLLKLLLEVWITMFSQDCSLVHVTIWCLNMSTVSGWLGGKGGLAMVYVSK